MMLGTWEPIIQQDWTHHELKPQTPSRTVAGSKQEKVNGAAVLTERQELQQPRDPRRLSHPGCFFSQMFFTLPVLQSLRSFPPRTRLWDEEAAPARWLTPSCHAFRLEFVSELNDLAPRIVAFFSPLSFFPFETESKECFCWSPLAAELGIWVGGGGWWVFMWSPWRCCCCPVSLSHSLFLTRLLYCALVGPRCSAVSRSQALPTSCLPYHEVPALWTHRCWDVFNNKVSCLTMCPPPKSQSKTRGEVSTSLRRLVWQGRQSVCMVFEVQFAETSATTMSIFLKDRFIRKNKNKNKWTPPVLKEFRGSATSLWGLKVPYHNYF